MIEGIVFRYRSGIAWRDLPTRFGPWQTVWKRHHRFATDGTWDRLLAAVQADADAAGEFDWDVSVDSTVIRAHQHSATAKRLTDPANTVDAVVEVVADSLADTGGAIELQETGLLPGRTG